MAQNYMEAGNNPGRRESRPIFYGWMIVGAAFAGTFALALTTTEALSIFMKPLAEDFGWSRTFISGAIALGTLLCAPAALLVGPLVDRHGARLVAALAGVAVGLSFLGMAVTGIPLFLPVAPLVFYIAASASRTAGVGVMGLAVTTAVANWFVRKRGRAIAIASLGSSVSTISMPLVAQLIGQAYGWQMSLVFLAIVVWSISIVPTLLFMRRRPEDMGLQPDGKSLPDTSATQVRHLGSGPGGSAYEDTYSNWRLSEAVHTLTLWLLIVSMALAIMVLAGTTLHQTAYLIEHGLNPVAATAAVSFFAVGTGVSRLVWGFLSERVPVRLCMASATLFMALGLVILLTSQGAPMAYLYAFIFGVGTSGSISLEPVIFANYFGRLHLGSIRGFSSLFRWVTAAAGPLLSGIGYDVTGSYFRVYLLFVFILIFIAIVLFAATPPKRQVTPAATA